MPAKPDENRKLMELTEFVKRIAEQKSRQASNSEAVQRARKAISERQHFTPKQISPPRATKFKF